MEPKTLISVEHLHKTYTGRTPTEVLKDVNFEVRSNEFVSILGASGSGKTTLIRILCGLERRTSGEVRVAEGLVFGFVFQDANLLPWLSAWENIALPLKLRGLTEREIVQKVTDALALVRLEQYGNYYPKDLSGGMKQRVSIARALVTNADVLLMDEPMASLDAVTREELTQELRELWKRLGVTILYVTHNLEEALQLSERVLVLSGRPAGIRKDFSVHAWK